MGRDPLIWQPEDTNPLHSITTAAKISFRIVISSSVQIPFIPFNSCPLIFP